MPAVDARERTSRFRAVLVENGLTPRLPTVRCGAVLMAANEAMCACQTLLGSWDVLRRCTRSDTNHSDVVVAWHDLLTRSGRTGRLHVRMSKTVVLRSKK